MTNTATLSEVQLSPFTGSENWYRHGINRAVLFTDGAKFLADQGGAYWLLDIIAIAQQHDARVSGEEFQVWNLKVHSDRSATVLCDDGNGNPVSRLSGYNVNRISCLSSSSNSKSASSL